MKVTFGSITREGCNVRRDLDVLHSALALLCCYDDESYDFYISLDNLRHEYLNENIDIKDILGDFRDLLNISLHNDKCLWK